jgi:hypothetical protein
MTKLKAPRRTKRQVGDCRVIPKTRLVVAMPADTVAAISIVMEQNGIVQSAQKLLRPVRAGVEQLPETAWLGGGYRSTCSQHRRTRRHPRNRHIPAEQACGFDPPWDAFGKTCRNIWPFELALCVVDKVGEAIIWQDVLRIHGSTRSLTLVRAGDLEETLLLVPNAPRNVHSARLHRV